MSETVQSSRLELVQRALKQIENELFAQLEPGIQELQISSMMSRIAKVWRIIIAPSWRRHIYLGVLQSR